MLGNLSIEKDTNTDKFILTNKGGYFYFSKDSKYRGLYYLEKKDENSWTLFKTIDDINFNCEDKVILNKLNNVERHTNKGILKYYFLNDSFVIETDVKGEINFNLDMREIYEFDDKGRIYDIYYKKGCIIIEYKKFWDNQLESTNYTRYLAIKTNIGNFEKILKWKEQNYKEDEIRKSFPWKLYIFDALSLKCNRKSRIVISFASSMETALMNVKKSFNQGLTEKTEAKKINTTIERVFSYNLALKSLDDLYVKFNNYEGFYAGLPWFFQFWTRDEAISLKALINNDRLEIVKKILFEKIENIGDEGRIQNRVPFAELATADGTGWVFKRVLDMIEKTKEKNLPLDTIFTQEELYLLRRQLKKSIDAYISNFSTDFLIKNNPNETWMDTSYNNDTREGFRIEIQALWLSMLKLSNLLDQDSQKNEEYKELEEKTKQKIRENFFEGYRLKDGKDDSTIRPNVFLAHYIYPELLTKEEWENVFDNSLDKLWLEWGGLSTIQKDSPLFFSNYTGEDNKSYHRGDSWFFINNIAAICLNKINKEKYNSYIDKIIDASSKDILYFGIIGRPSELSSASSKKAEGSLFQLWSAATFVELMELMFH